MVVLWYSLTAYVSMEELIHPQWRILSNAKRETPP
jgi:hypothetical protein